MPTSGVSGPRTEIQTQGRKERETVREEREASMIMLAVTCDLSHGVPCLSALGVLSGNNPTLGLL